MSRHRLPGSPRENGNKARTPFLPPNPRTHPPPTVSSAAAARAPPPPSPRPRACPPPAAECGGPDTRAEGDVPQDDAVVPASGDNPGVVAVPREVEDRIRVHAGQREVRECPGRGRVRLDVRRVHVERDDAPVAEPRRDRVPAPG